MPHPIAPPGSSGTGGVIVEDEGSVLGTFTVLNFTGNLVTASAAGPTATIQIGTLTETAGSALAIGKAVYYNATTGRMTYASNNDADVNARVVYAITLTSAAAAGDPVQVQTIPGTLVSVSGLGGATTADIRRPVYLGTNGDFTLTPPGAGTTVVRAGYLAKVVGLIYTILFNPQVLAQIP